jgi:hypothetical protein
MGTMYVSDIINGASQDVRRMLDSANPNAASDIATLVDYTNRIQLQLMREYRWRFLLSNTLQFSTVANFSDYWVGPTGGNPATAIDTGLNLTNVGNVKPGTVFDRTNFHRLQSTDEAPLGPDFSNPSSPTSINSRPRLYRNDASTPYIFSVYPPADKPYVIEFRYFFQKPQLTQTSQALLIPDDYKDVVIAGVNWFASLYLRENMQDAQMWKMIYQEGITGMHRDHNLFPRGQEFISPDPASTPRTVSIPIGLDSGIETSIP